MDQSRRCALFRALLVQCPTFCMGGRRVSSSNPGLLGNSKCIRCCCSWICSSFWAIRLFTAYTCLCAQFDKAGLVGGVQCWQVVGSRVKPWAQNHFGIFYSQECYIVLHTVQHSSVSLTYDVGSYPERCSLLPPSFPPAPPPVCQSYSFPGGLVRSCSQTPCPGFRLSNPGASLSPAPRPLRRPSSGSATKRSTRRTSRQDSKWRS